MANTTNFNWETPDDTDLVKDGAAAIRTLGSAIDTSLVDLKGGTTGQVLSKATNTDMDFTWVAQDDSNAIQNAIIDAKGDLIVGSAADTPARLAVGTNDYVLTADSSATNGVKWAAAATGGGMTLINSGGTALSGQQITVSSIPGTYVNLYIVIVGAVASGAANTSFRLNTDTGSNYTYRATKNTTTIARDYGANLDRGYIGLCANTSSYNNIGRMEITIPRYADTAYKQVLSDVNFGDEWWSSSNSWNNTAAITAFTIFADSASGFTGGTMYVYGVK